MRRPAHGLAAALRQDRHVGRADINATVDAWIAGGLQFANGAAYSYVVLIGTGTSPGRAACTAPRWRRYWIRCWRTSRTTPSRTPNPTSCHPARLCRSVSRARQADREHKPHDRCGTGKGVQRELTVGMPFDALHVDRISLQRCTTNSPCYDLSCESRQGNVGPRVTAEGSALMFKKWFGGKPKVEPAKLVAQASPPSITLAMSNASSITEKINRSGAKQAFRPNLPIDDPAFLLGRIRNSNKQWTSFQLLAAKY